MLHTCVSTKGWRFCWFIDNTVIEGPIFARPCTRCWMQWKSKLGSCPHGAESLEKWLDTKLVSKSMRVQMVVSAEKEKKPDWNDRKTRAGLLRGSVQGSPSEENEKEPALQSGGMNHCHVQVARWLAPSSTPLPPPKHSIPEQYTGRDSTGLLLQCWSRSGSEHPSAGSPSQAQ